MAPAFGSDWFCLIWDFLVKSSGALLIAILLAGLMRRQSASLRHFVLSLFLVGLVFLPLFSVLPSGWEMRWLPAWLEARGQAPESAAAAPIGGHLLQNERSGLLSSSPADWEFNEAGRSLPFAGVGLQNRGRALGLGLILFWFAGLGFLLSRLALGIAGALRLTREGERLEGAVWQQLLRRFVSLVSLRREVDLKSHQKVLVPLTWGFLKPVVIMPAEAESWTEEQRASALFHELSHVKRRDFLIMLLVRLSLALYWLNPLTWVVFRMLKKEQEKACDELVIRAGIRPSIYAANLLSFKRAAYRAGSPAVAFLGVLGMFGRSQLNDRLASILQQKFAFREVKMKTKVIISALAIAAVAFIGLARPSGASAPHEMGAIPQEPVIGAVESLSPDTPVQENQESQEGRQQKPAEKAEQSKEPQEKAKKTTTLKVGVPISGEDAIEITVIEGDTKKVIRVEKPVIKVKKDEAGKKIVVLSGEKEVLAIEGGDVQIKVTGDKFLHLKRAEPLKLEKGLVIKSTTKYEPGERTIIIEGKPYVEIVKEVGTSERTTIYFKSKEGEGHTYVIAPRVKGDQTFHLRPVPVEPHVHMEPPVGVEPRVVVEPKVAVEPHVSAAPRVVVEPHVAVEPHVHEPELLVGTIHQEELQKKIAETQALLKKIEAKEFEEAKVEAQKETLRELKEALKDLQQELEKEKEGFKKAVRVTIDKPEKSFSVVLAKPYVTGDAKMGVLEEGKDNVITIIDDKGTCTIVFTGKLGEGQLETYEKAVEKLKKDLPDGYELESEFHEKSGTIVVKVKGRNTTEESQGAVKKLVQELKEELLKK